MPDPVPPTFTHGIIPGSLEDDPEPPPEPNWTWDGRVVRWLDGDTVVVDIDQGFRVHSVQVLRLLGIDTPEMVGADRAAAEKSRSRAEALAPGGGAVKVRSHKNKHDKYGRFLCEIWSALTGGRTVNALLLAEGLAKPYPKDLR